MKRIKFLTLILVFTLCICNLGTSVFARTIIDINDDTDSFPLAIAGNDYQKSPNDYKPYVSSTANMYVRIYTQDYDTNLIVKLVNKNTGSTIEYTASGWRSTLFFDNLNKDNIYYLQFHNKDSKDAYIDVNVF